MDSVNIQYRDIVERIFQEYADFLGNDDGVKVELVFDEKRDRYLLIETGWQKRCHNYMLNLSAIDRQLGLITHGINILPTPM